MKTIPAPKAGDPCPQCGGAFVEHRAPSDEERAAASDRENPRALPPRVDTATKEQRDELGALHECKDCGYKTRIPPTLDQQVQDRNDADAAARESGGQPAGSGANARRRAS